MVTRDSRNLVNASYDLNQRPSISLSPLKQSEEFYLCLVVCRLAVFSCHAKRRIWWCWKHFGWYYFPMIPCWDCFHLRTIVFILRGSLFWVMTSISHLTSLSLTGTNSQSSLRLRGLFWISQFQGKNEISGFKDSTVCSEEKLKIPHSWIPPSLFSSAGQVCLGSSRASDKRLSCAAGSSADHVNMTLWYMDPCGYRSLTHAVCVWWEAVGS